MKLKQLNFNAQINKLTAVIGSKINTVITAGKAQSEVFNIAKNSPNSVFEIIARESDFIRFGDVITSSLKTAGVKYSVFLIPEGTLNFDKPNEVFGSKSAEVIVLGGKNLISYALFYASQKTQNFHAVLTEPYVEGLLGNSVTLRDGGYVKVVPVSKLKTLILDKTIISKSSATATAYSYIKCAGKFVQLIDYKLAVLTGEKRFNKEDYDRARLAATLTANIKSFSNPVEVLTYASLLNAVILVDSNLFDGGGHGLVSHALELIIPDADEGDLGFIALDRLIKLYHAFFVNDLTNILSVADYNADVALLSKISGKPTEFFYNNLKIPSEKRRLLLIELIKKTKNQFVVETQTALKVLGEIKANYLAFKKQKSILNLKYAVIKQGVTLAPYLDSKITVLTLLRDFGVLKTAK